jgi:hypothetical protein
VPADLRGRSAAASIIHHDSVLAADTTIRYRATDSVTQLDIGDTISVTIDQASQLANAYLDTIAQRFAE